MFFKRKKSVEVPVDNYLLAARLAEEAGNRELANVFANIAILKIKTSIIESSTAPR